MKSLIMKPNLSASEIVALRYKPKLVVDVLYPWHEIPDRYQWCTISRENTVMAFINEPVSHGSGRWFDPVSDEYWIVGTNVGECHWWKDSLQRRPS